MKNPAEDRPEQDETIWEATKPLSLVKRWAIRYGASPWASLGAILVRIAAEDCWLNRVPGIQGGKEGASVGSLSVIAVSPSGHGKSNAKKVAGNALKILHGELPARNRWRSVSTSEGAFAFFQDLIPDPNHEPELNKDGTPKKIIPRLYKQTRFQAVGFVDEIGELIAKADRHGNWLIEFLSSAILGVWGEIATKENPRPKILDGTHCGIYIAGLDHLTGQQIGDTGPQGWATRQVLFDAIYPEAVNAVDDGNDIPPIKITIPACYEPEGNNLEYYEQYPEQEFINLWSEPATVKKQIALEALEQLAGLRSKGHYNLMKRRLMKALALLHNEQSSLIEHWELADVIMKHDNNIREYLLENEGEYILQEDRRNRRKAVQRNQAVRTQEDATEDIIEKAERMFRRDYPQGFTLTDLKNLPGQYKERLADNPGLTPAKQLVSAWNEDGKITWDGKKEDIQWGTRGLTYRWLPA